MNDLVPDCWIYVQDAGVKLGRIQIFNNWSPYMVAEPDKKVWIGLEYFCKENDEFWNMSEEACRKFAVDELIRMGASIRVSGRVAVVTGVERLHSAPVRCTDLRGGADLCVAALAAEGETRVSQICHIDRGYEDLARDLRALGADAVRVEETENG